MKAALFATLGFILLVTSLPASAHGSGGPQPSPGFASYLNTAEQSLSSYKGQSRACMRNGAVYFASCMNSSGYQAQESFNGWYVAVANYSQALTSDDVTLQREFLSDADSTLLQLDNELAAAGQPAIQVQPVQQQQPQPPVQYGGGGYYQGYPQGYYPYPSGSVVIVTPGTVTTTTTVTEEDEYYDEESFSSGEVVHHPHPHPKPVPCPRPTPPPCGCHR